MFWFMLIALAVVVAAVALAVLGDGGELKDAEPDRLQDRLPTDRALVRADIDAVRLPVTVRGYRMIDVDEVLDRLSAELAERDARIAELESSLPGARSRGMSLAKDPVHQGARPDAYRDPYRDGGRDDGRDDGGGPHDGLAADRDAGRAQPLPAPPAGERGGAGDE